MRVNTHIPRDSRVYDGCLVGKNNVLPADAPLEDLTPIGAASSDTVVYVNGINTSIEKQRQDMRYIAAAKGHKVIGVHNATAGVVRDLGQCLLDKLDMQKNSAVKTVENMVKQAMKSGQQLALIAHSQGALICSRALWGVQKELREGGLSEKEAKEKLAVVNLETAGGAAHTYPDGPSYHHRVNRFDPVPGSAGINSYVPGKKLGENAKVTVITRIQDHYTKDSDSLWDYFPNVLDRTVHGVEVYYNKAGGTAKA